MSAGFTSGPWHIEPNGYDCAGFATSVCGADGLPVASCDNNDFALQKANARLIAAAPDGFEAGEEAIAALNAMMAAWFDYHDAHSLTQPVTGAAGNAFNMALAAREKLETFVAKANGEQVHSDPLPKEVGR